MHIKKWLKLLSFALIIAVLLVIVGTHVLDPLIQGDSQALEEASQGSMPVFLLLLLVLMMIQNLFTIIPLILLITVNVTYLGFIYGFLWSWFCSIIGGVLCFFASRYWFQEFFVRWVKPEYQQKIENNGLAMVFIGRIFPFIPTSAVNIAAGLSAIKFRHFLYGTMLGNFIFFFIMALIPYGIMNSSQPYLYFVLIAVAAVGVLLWRKYKKNKDAMTLETESEKSLL